MLISKGKSKKVLFGKSEIKKASKSNVKKDLDVLYSMVVRMESASLMGVCPCVSCGKPFFWNKIQNGHYIKRSECLYMIYSWVNTHPQCYNCNVNLGGNLLKYRIWMVEKYGEKEVLLLESKAKSGTKDFNTITEYEVLARECAKRVGIQCERLNYEPTQRQFTILNRWL
jgi:hypothetical protein